MMKEGLCDLSTVQCMHMHSGRAPATSQPLTQLETLINDYYDNKPAADVETSVKSEFIKHVSSVDVEK